MKTEYKKSPNYGWNGETLIPLEGVKASEPNGVPHVRIVTIKYSSGLITYAQYTEETPIGSVSTIGGGDFHKRIATHGLPRVTEKLIKELHETILHDHKDAIVAECTNHQLNKGE